MAENSEDAHVVLQAGTQLDGPDQHRQIHTTTRYTERDHVYEENEENEETKENEENEASSEQQPRQSRWKNYCYVLINDKDNKTYNGYTNNPARRLRQHNGEIAGGARYTTRRKARDGPVPRNWEYLVVIEAPGMSQRQALQLEWHIKHPTNRYPRPRTFNGANGRLASLPLAMSNPKFAGLHFLVRVLDRYYERARKTLLLPLPPDDNTNDDVTANAKRKMSAQGTTIALRPMPSDVHGDEHLAPQLDSTPESGKLETTLDTGESIACLVVTTQEGEARTQETHG